MLGNKLTACWRVLLLWAKLEIVHYHRFITANALPNFIVMYYCRNHVILETDEYRKAH